MFKLFSRIKSKGKTCPECGTEMTKNRSDDINFKSYPVYLWVWHCDNCGHTEGGEAINKSSQAFANYKDWEKD